MSWVEVPPKRYVGDLDLSSLGVDEAYLNINISSDIPASLYALSDDCYRCPYVYDRELNGSTDGLVVSTKHGTTWRLYSDFRHEPTIDMADNDDLLCEFRPKSLGQFGVYSVNVPYDSPCTVETIATPVNIYFPLIIVVGTLLGAGFLGCIFTALRHKCCPKAPVDGPPARKRIRALDTFRGISIAFMIFVNYGGGQYSILNHSTWNGLHLADLCFPWFMWIMGVCVPIAVGSQIKKKVNRCVILMGVIKRSLMLFLLGLSLNTIGVGAELSHIRVMGVLQRFAITYFIVASLMTLLSFNFTFDKSKQSQGGGVLSDVLYLLPQWLVILALVAAHCYITFFMPIPNCPSGYLGPGGVQFSSKYLACSGGAAGYVDRLIFGTSHMYQHPTADAIYHSGIFDPEGLLGCLTSILQVFLGVQAGYSLMHYGKAPTRVMLRWLVWGTCLGLGGAILSQCRQDGGWLPVNKNLWTLSFVFATSSMAFFLLTFLFYVIDYTKIWKGCPFVYPGMNALICYVGHEMTTGMFPWSWSLGPMNTHLILMIENVWGTALWILISYFLYRKKFFLSL